MNHTSGWALLGLGLVAASGALAQSSPYYLGASQAFGHASNVRNLPDGPGVESDTFSTTTLSAGLNQPIGRQRLFGDAQARYTRYNDADDLDNTGYDLRLGLDWATVARLSGTLLLGSTQNLSRLNPGNAPLASTRNLERTNSIDGRFRLGGEGRLALEATLGHRRVDFSAAEFASREYDQNSLGGGIIYRLGGSLTLSTGLTGQNSKYPRGVEVAPGQFEPDRSERRDLYVGATWVPTGASTLVSRLSYSKIEYDRAVVNDFSGLTGSLNWLWRPTGKLQFTTTASRDSGQEGGFAAAALSPTTPGTGGGGPTTPPPGPTTPDSVATSDFSRVTNSLGFRAVYDLTAKVRLNADVTHSRRGLANPSGGSGSDRSTGYALGATWAPTRSLEFGCDLSRETRSTSTVLSSDMQANLFSCFGSIVLQ